MTVRPIFALLAFASAATNALAADCPPDPLAGRPLYLRGSFNNFVADDETALPWR